MYLCTQKDMISFPHSKINIGLNITEKRADGYHNLETIFYPIPLADKLEITQVKGDKKTNLHTVNNLSEVKMEDNLVYKAYALLKEKYQLPEINIVLEKNIPTGAGLGGGSADASFMLKMLNEKFDLKISNKELEDYASQLGADCPFFIGNKPQYATGIGTVFSSVSLSLKGYFLILIKPDIHVSTQDAYSLVVPKKSDFLLTEMIKKPITEWKNWIKNDFEKSIFPKYPQIEKIKSDLYQNGALYASMSGSGSSVYGIVKEKKDLKSLFPTYEYFLLEL